MTRKLNVDYKHPIYTEPLGYKGRCIVDIEKIKLIMAEKNIERISHFWESATEDSQIDSATVYRIFQGKLVSPHLYTVYHLSNALGVKIDDIIKISEK